MSNERIDAYEYDLPVDRIAQRPAWRRDASRLLVARRGSPRVDHRVFSDLPEQLDAGDLLVINDTKVIPARIRVHKPTGARIEVLLLHPLDSGDWEAMVRPSARVRSGAILVDDDGREALTVHEPLDGGHRRVTLAPDRRLETLGEPPLPPYIHRPDGVDDEDRDRYQTVYAEREGAVAAPTAGLHFTEGVMTALAARNIGIARLTLHVGAGTFEPVRVERLDEHRMHAERYSVPAAAAAAIEDTAARGGRVVAVGTTVVRSLEAWAREGAPTDGAFRRTDLFLRPGSTFRRVDAMVTNFHLPRSTLLVLLAAFAGREWILERYREAVREGYRFYSYGDAMLLL
jgi:S-adenosylmethionine:tRNA ribosyltransferase-isomerase